MYKTIFATILILSQLGTLHASGARLLRFPATNGNTIVFTHAGDLYTVPAGGGVARQLTSHQGLEIFPRFSPDGQTIAFTGQFNGNTEVYTIPAEGGIPGRLTFSATLERDDLGDRMGPNNIVLTWSPGGDIIYRSRHRSFNAFIGHLFKVSPAGGLPARLELPEGGFTTFSPDGNRIAYNRVFREFRTWKYYQGGMADDIWIHDFTTRQTTRITDHPAQDIIPMWIGDQIFFLSDRDRTMNFFVYDIPTGTTEKVTNFTDFDVKFPSHHGTKIVFEKGGFIYELDALTREVKRIPVTINNDQNFSRSRVMNAAERIFSADLSPNGERVLFSARGELFSVPADKGITYNLTRSPGNHDRNGSWSPDGKKVAWLSDKSGEFEIWLTCTTGETSPRQLTANANTYKFNIAWSPDSRLIAWNDQDFNLYVTDVETGNTREMASSNLAPLNDFNWSPDSRWIAYTNAGANRMGVIYLLNVASGQSFPVTDKWHDSYGPVFSADGKYLLFASDRSFRPIYSNTEWNHAYINMAKIYVVMLSSDTPSPFAPRNKMVMPVEPTAPEQETPSPKRARRNNNNNDENITRIDLTGIGNRIVALPVEPANYFNISSINNKVYYNRVFQGREENLSLLVFDLEQEKETLVGDFRYTLSAKNNKMLLGKDKTWTVIAPPTGPVTIEKPVDLSAMQAKVNFQDEWEQIFDEAWRQMRDFFYVDNMHGVNWEAMRDKYRPLVAHVNHRTDLNYVIGEMIGELNAGHAYINPGDQPRAERVQTGLLGAELSNHESGFFRIDKILEGAPWSPELLSPLRVPGVNVREGEYITAINRVPANSVNNIFELLVGTAGRVVELSINNIPALEGSRHVLVTPLADESQLYYLEWVKENIRVVNEATNGQIGYLHIPDMGPGGLNEFVKFFYPQLHKQGLIIDVRGNGGGNVSPMILERLNRVPYRVNMRRNSPVVSTIPAQTLVGPMVTLIDRFSASDGDLFAHGFRELGLGTLVGTRTWGGVIGITASLPFIDGTDFRIPQFTSLSMEGEWIIEGIGVHPDIEIDNDPYRQFKGIDDQLQKAIEVILEKLPARQGLPSIPAPPVKTGPAGSN